MKTINLLKWASVAAFACGAAVAQAKTVDARKITCEEYVGLDETVKPQLLMFIEGVNKAGKKEAAVVELDQLSRPLDFVAIECQKTPKATVWQKVENYMKNVTKKL